MNELEQLREYEALLMEEMDEMAQELVNVRAEIARLSAEESDNEYWDVHGSEVGTVSYKLKALNEAYDLFRNGNREEYHYSFSYPAFQYRYIATLTDDIPPANLAHYSRAAVADMGKLIVWNTKREGPILSDVYDEEGVRVDGLKIPFASTVEGGVRDSTIKMREYWQKDSTVQFHRRKANLTMRRMDREHLLARIFGGMDKFNEKYPFYVSEDDWEGPTS